MTLRDKQGEPVSGTEGSVEPRPARSPRLLPGPGPSTMRTGYFGIEGLDDMLPYGLTYDTQIMAEGDTGIGKSVLAAQFLYEGLVTGDTCIYIACDEPPDVMRENMTSFRLGTRAHEAAGKLIFVDAYARDRSKEKYHIPDPSNFDEFFLYEKKVVEMAAGNPTRLIVDSVSTILATATTPEIISFNATRLRYLRSRNVLTLDSIVWSVLEDRALNGLRHAYPMILYMKYIRSEGMMQRYLQLGKLKSGQFQATQHLFSIDPRTGIVVQR